MTGLAAALDVLPKVELHCHIEGSMRPTTVVELARANDIPLPTEDPTELYRYDSLDGFLEVFWLVQSTLCARADWTRLAYEAVLDSSAHGVVHQECFFTPTRHLVEPRPRRYRGRTRRRHRRCRGGDRKYMPAHR